jgi:hypothetical protein
MAKKQPLEIDMNLGSQIRDIQGEVLDVEGADISELERGNGFLNDNHAVGFFNRLGRITSAKKIFKEQDCDNDRQRYYWNQVKAPYIFAAGYLYDNEEHANAKACAAILRNIHKTDCPLQLKASVEGSVIQRGIKDSTILQRTKIMGAALTFTPANRNTLVEPINLTKSLSPEQDQIDQQLIKSVIHLAKQDHEIPSFRHITRNASANKIVDNLQRIADVAAEAGFTVTISDISPEQLIKKSLKDKVKENIVKIANLVKAASWSNQRQESVNQRRDTFASQKGSLWSSGSQPQATPAAKPAGSANTMQTVSGSAFQDKIAQLRAKKSELESQGMSEEDVEKCMQSATNDMFKDDDIDGVQKGEVWNAVRGMILAGSLAAGAYHMSPTSNDTTARAPAAKQREIPQASKEIQRNQVMPTNPSTQRQPTIQESINGHVSKALTAGCGGSSPTSSVGGQVLQSESLEDGRSKTKKNEFKYVTCHHCGKEQVYVSNGIKCRHCNKSFNMAQLYPLMVQE